MIRDVKGRFKIIKGYVNDDPAREPENQIVFLVESTELNNDFQYDVAVLKYLIDPDNYSITFEDATEIWDAYMQGNDEVIVYYTLKYSV